MASGNKGAGKTKTEPLSGGASGARQSSGSRAASAANGAGPGRVKVEASEEDERAGTGPAAGPRPQNPEWSEEEVKALEAGLGKWPGGKTALVERAVRIASTLPNKTARDVAMRIVWATKRSGTEGAQNGSEEKRAVGKKEGRREEQRWGRSTTSGGGKQGGGGGQLSRQGSIFSVQANPAGASLATVAAAGGVQVSGGGSGGEGSMDGGPGGQVAQLLEQNFHIIGQIRTNMQHFKVNENTELLVRMRDNTVAILNSMSASEGVMSQMPPLPVRMNAELANNFLPKVIGQAPAMAPQPPPQQQHQHHHPTLMMQMAHPHPHHPGMQLHPHPHQQGALCMPAGMSMPLAMAGPAQHQMLGVPGGMKMVAAAAQQQVAMSMPQQMQ